VMGPVICNDYAIEKINLDPEGPVGPRA